jgi:hypothetical protein
MKKPRTPKSLNKPATTPRKTSINKSPSPTLSLAVDNTPKKIKRMVQLKKLIGNKKLCYYMEMEQWAEITRLRYSTVFESEESALEARAKNTIVWQDWQQPN